MSRVADFLQILSISTTLLVVVICIIAGVQGHKFYQVLLSIKQDIETTAAALRNNGKPISIKEELAGFEQAVGGEVVNIEDSLKTIAQCQEECLLGRGKCAEMIRSLYENPYQLCNKMLSCPANQAKMDEYKRLQDLIIRKWTADDEARKETHKRLDDIVEFILANRDIFNTFTGELGVELLRTLKRERQNREKD